MSMTLKESFRYQNFLDTILGQAENYLRMTENYMIVTEEHLRNKVIPAAENDTFDNLADREIQVKPDVLVDFVITVLTEKEALTKAINIAKAQHCNELDALVEVNKFRRGVIETLKRMSRSKGKESTLKGNAYTFNAEGNQTQYYYDIKRTSKIDFDRPKLKRLISLLATESDRTSATIDYWQTSVPVDFTPQFDLNDTFEELAEAYSLTMAS